MIHPSRFASRVGFSETGAISERAAALAREGRSVINLSVGQPDFDTPPAAMEGARAALLQGKTRYTAPHGTLELRQEIARKFERENQISVDPAHEIFVSSGAKQAVFELLAAVVSPDEEILIPAPAWVSYGAMVRLLGATPQFLPSDRSTRYRLTPDALRAAIGPRTTGIVINTPNNPTGVVYRREELAALAEVVAESGLWVVSDEIYERIVFEGHPHCSWGTAAPQLTDRLAIVNGVSKAFAMTGWRIGYAAGPREWIEMAIAIQSQASGNPCSISQEAARCALAQCDSDAARMRDAFESRRSIVLSLLEGTPGLHVFPPEGAFYVFVGVQALLDRPKGSGPRFTSDEELAAWLLEETGVATVPGTAFAAPGHIRISFAASEEQLREALQRVRGAIASLGASS
jgi:aspartate aminotransferase